MTPFSFFRAKDGRTGVIMGISRGIVECLTRGGMTYLRARAE